MLNNQNFNIMGYMGFGLQRWIYTQKPRKPYIFGTRSAEDSQIFHDHKKYNQAFINKQNKLSSTSIKKGKLGNLIKVLLLLVIFSLTVIALVYLFKIGS